MTAVTVGPRHRSNQPRRFSGVRRFMSVKIPSTLNSIWDWAERHPRFAIAALFIVVAVAWAVRSELGAMALTAVAAFIFGRGVGLVRFAALKDKLAAAERDRDLYKASADATAQDRNGLRSELSSLMAASRETQQLPIIPLGGGQ